MSRRRSATPAEIISNVAVYALMLVLSFAFWWGVYALLARLF